jgi:histidinol-phosphate aminotransferase
MDAKSFPRAAEYDKVLGLADRFARVAARALADAWPAWVRRLGHAGLGTPAWARRLGLLDQRHAQCLATPSGGEIMTGFLSVAVAGVRDLTPYQPGKPIEELEREYGIRDAVKLASNENPLGCGAHARAAMTQAMAQVALYPDGNGFALKRALAEALQVGTDQLILGNGSSEVLELVARAFVSQNDEVVFAAHAFALYPLITQALGARAVVVPTVDFRSDLAAMAAAINGRTRLVFLANPNNPLGTWSRRHELESFLAAVPPDVVVVLDEAYFEYVTEVDYPNGLDYLAAYPNLVVARTFSKIHGLAGLRIGYGATSPEVADLVNRIRQPFNTNHLAQAAAVAALADPEHTRASAALNLAGLSGLVNGCIDRQLPFIPSVANFLTIRVGDGAAIYERLLRQGVIVRPLANYGLAGYLRVTVGTAEQMDRFLAALDRILARGQ